MNDKNWLKLTGWAFVIFLVVEAIRLAVKAINIAAAWVAAHYVLCFLILAGIALILYFCLNPKWYIGKPEGQEVDPLFCKSARYAVREQLSGTRPAIVNSLSSSVLPKNMRNLQRADGLFVELACASILNTDDGVHYSVTIHNKWGLKKVFKEINANKHFFSEAIQRRTASVKSSLEHQALNAENEADKTIITFLCYRNSIDIACDFFSYQLACCSPESVFDKKTIEENLATAEGKYPRIDLIEKTEAVSVLQDSIQLLETTIDDLSIDSVNLKGLSINGSPFDIPRIEREEWELYLLPSFAVLFRDKFFDGQEVRIVYYRDIEVSGGYYTEEAGDFDTEGMEYEWRWEHQRVDGGPDMRYNENEKIYSYKFFRVDIPQLLLKQDFRLRSQAEGLIQDFETLKALATDSKGGDPRFVQL